MKSPRSVHSNVYYALNTEVGTVVGSGQQCEVLGAPCNVDMAIEDIEIPGHWAAFFSILALEVVDSDGRSGDRAPIAAGGVPGELVPRLDLDLRLRAGMRLRATVLNLDGCGHQFHLLARGRRVAPGGDR